jgi:hypothetical protein
VAFLLLLWEQAPLPRFRLYRKCATAVNGKFCSLPRFLLTSFPSLPDGLCQIAQLIFDGQIPMDEEEEEERKAEDGKK